MPQPYWSMERKPALGGIVRPVFPSFCISEQRRRNAFPRHRHPSYELILVEQGTYVARLNGTRLALRAGRGLLVKPGDWHEDACVPPLRYRGLRFQMEWPGGRNPALFDPGTPAASQAFAAPPLFQELFERIKAESQRSDAASPLLLAAQLEELFWRVVRALRQEALAPAFRQLAEEHALAFRMERLFQSRQDGPLPVGEMARALGVAERTLERQCRLLFGEPPARCFARFKVGRAVALLRETSLSVKEIGAALGFDNPYHFSRVFRRLQGRPPSALRRAKPE